MDVASLDEGTNNEARNMQKAEKESKKLEKEYKAEQKKPEPKKTIVLDALRECYSEYILKGWARGCTSLWQRILYPSGYSHLKF